MSLTVSVANHDSYVIVAVRGEIDLSTADQFRAELFEALDQGGRNCIVNLAEVPYISSQGLRVLTTALERARGVGSTVRLAAPQPSVAMVMRITGLYDLFDVFPSVRVASSEGPVSASGQET